MVGGELWDTRGQTWSAADSEEMEEETKEPKQRFLAENGRMKGIRLRKQLCLIAVWTLLPRRLSPTAQEAGAWKDDVRSSEFKL